MVVSGDLVIQVMIWGLYAGCIYILLATGLNLIFGVMKVVNFAHGELLMLGAYITFTFYALSGFNPYVLLAASLPILIAVGVIIERTCFRPILGTGKLNEIFISIGLIYIIQNAAAMIWTDEWQTIQSPFEQITVKIFGVNMPLDYHYHHHNHRNPHQPLPLPAANPARKGDEGHQSEPERGDADGHQCGEDGHALLWHWGWSCRCGGNPLGRERPGLQSVYRLYPGRQGLCHRHYRRAGEHSRCHYRRADLWYRRELRDHHPWRSMEGCHFVYHPDPGADREADRYLWGVGRMIEMNKTLGIGSKKSQGLTAPFLS